MPTPSNFVKANYHPDGEWDCSLGFSRGTGYGWQDSLVIETENATVKLHSSGTVSVEGDFEVINNE